jgi:intein/homing endonuclease
MKNLIKLNINQEKNIIRMKKLGINNSIIINKYNIAVGTIYKILKRNGREHLIPNKKYQVNENYFEKIDNEEKAYWLGFLYADGNVRLINGRSGQLKLKLKQSDKKHIEKFNECLNSNYPINDGMEIVKSNDREYKCHFSVVNIYNTKLVKDLFNIGCMNNKTYKLKFPTFLDNTLIRHFIRGYFDGDGCIHKNIYRPDSFAIYIVSANRKFLKNMTTYVNYTSISKRNTIY